MSQTTLWHFESDELSKLTPAERTAYVAVRMNGVGVREHARATGRSPGTVGNLLSRADTRLDGDDR